MLEKLDQLILEHIRKSYLDPINFMLQGKQQRSVHYYSLTHGLVGIALYLFRRKDSIPLQYLLEEIIQLLTRLALPFEFHKKMVEGWFVNENHSESTGYYNLGLANGVAGVLAFFSQCVKRGYGSTSILSSIKHISQWLIRESKEKERGVLWPIVMPIESGVEDFQLYPSQTWAYGAPGIARALWLASQTLNCQTTAEFSMNCFCKAAQQNRDFWGLPTPTINQGLAGYLMIVQQMAQNTEKDTLKNFSETIKQTVLKYYDINHPFGFKHYYFTQNQMSLLDSPGLLNGVVGILLSLLATESENSDWQDFFLV
jgi:hypothetical protein